MRPYQITKHIVWLMLLLGCPQLAAQISGVVTDSITKEPLEFISVYYEGTGIGTATDLNGRFSVEKHPERKALTFSAIGYKTKVVPIDAHTTTINTSLAPDEQMLSEVFVRPKREKYSRRNNPAVDLMRKVIARKKQFRLEDNDFYRYFQYQKMKTSLNNLTQQSVKQGILKGIPFIAEQLEPSPRQNDTTLILPISIQETASEIIYRKHPESRKTVLRGMLSSGIDELISTGDNLGKLLAEAFKTVNIYDNDIALLRSRFVSPIGDGAISFYQYYLMDTLVVGRDECIHLSFVPANSQDFGFTGHLYVVNDSTLTVKRCTMNLPRQTGVNFVQRLSIEQEFERLPNGQWVLTDDDMAVDLYLVKQLQGILVERTTKYTDYHFEPFDNPAFRAKGDVIKETDLLMKSDEFWADARQVPLTKTESQMDLFINRLTQIPGVRIIVFVLKALIENFVETGSLGNPSKFDIGPINTIVNKNSIEGWRFRLSGTTTAKLHPQLFASGYVAYGLGDRRWKYEGDVAFALHKQEFFPWEFPKNYFKFVHRYDVRSPMDKFLFTDKDNVFVAMKATADDQKSYIRESMLQYEVENNAGMALSVSATHRNDEPAGALQYIRNDAASTPVHDITTAELAATLTYSPGRRYINSKQRRYPVSIDMPVYTLSHTAGFKGVLGGEYDFNFTEASIWKRFWLSSWGHVDATLKGGVQWNKVPFPLLIIPAANLSYITQQETFMLLNSMEFLNDRYASLTVTYEMNGKFFNRIPLIKKLKWREVFRFRTLWGTLTDKNNPNIQTNDPDLFRFPSRNGMQTAHVMNPKEPYMEISVGVYNIFKLLHVEYVRRLNYLNHPNIHKDGIRFMVLMRF